MTTHHTTTQAASRLGVSPRRVRAMIRQGHFPGAQLLGRDWLIPAAEVEAARVRKTGRPRKEVCR